MIYINNVCIAVTHHKADEDWAGCGRYLSLRDGRSMQEPELPIDVDNTMKDADIERLWAGMIEITCGSLRFGYQPKEPPQ